METWYGMTFGVRQPQRRPDPRDEMRREAEILRAEQRAIRRGRPYPRTLRRVWQAGSTTASRVAS
jgi:hypothetical protein